MEKYNIKNIMEDFTSSIYDEIIQKSEYCKCERCKVDTLALALKNLKPRYVVTLKGEVYAKTDMLFFQLRADVIQELYRALQIVAAQPNH